MIISKCTSKPEYKLREAYIKRESKASFKRRILHAPNAIQTIDN